MSKNLRILLVEDNPGDADLILEFLPRDSSIIFQIEQVPRLTDAFERVRAKSFDVILLDLGLPDSSGLDTLHAMRREITDTPIVVMTGNDDEKIGLAAIKAGAQDFAVKGQVNNTLLSRIIQFAMERHQIIGQLRQSEENYRTLIEQASDGIFVSDAGGKYIEVNTSGCEMLGYTREEILTKNLTDMIPKQDLAGEAVKFGELRSGKTILSERNMIRKDGILLPTEISAKMLSDGRLQGIVRDITDRKRAEEETRRNAEELRKRNEDLERFNRAAVGRELRMIELKKQVNELNKQLGQKPPYPLLPTDESTLHGRKKKRTLK